MKKLLAILLALLMVLSIVGCAKEEAPADDAADDAADAPADDAADAPADDAAGSDYRIAFIQKGMDAQYFIDCDAGSKARAEELGVTCDFFAPDGGQSDIEGQINITNDCITQGYDIIMIDVCDAIALIPSIVAANDADIPVVLFNDNVDEDELAAQGGEYATYIGINSYEASKMVGEYCTEYSEPGKVLTIGGIPGVVASEERVNGFAAGLGEGFEVVASQPANWDMNEAYDVTTNMLTANPDISVIFSASCTMNLGVTQAIKDMGLEDQVDLYDFDCEQADLEGLIAGDLVATLRYPTLEWAALGVDTCVSILNGEDVEKTVYTLVEVVDAERAAELIG